MAVPSKLVASWVLAIYTNLSIGCTGTIGNWRGRHIPLGANLCLVGSKSRAKYIAGAKAQLVNVLARGLLWVILLGANLSLIVSKSRAKYIASAKAQLANILARGLLWVIHLCLRARTAWKEPLTLLFQVVTMSSRSNLLVLFIHSLKQRPLCTRAVHARSFLLYG